MKYLIRDYIYGWRLENFKEIYKNGKLAGMMFLYAFVINVTATGNIIMLGYYVSVAKGLDVDKPRNLAKSVTVE